MTMTGSGAVRLALALASVLLLGLGVLFLIASMVRPERALVGGPMLAGGLLLAYKLLRPQPQVLEVKVSWDPSGKLAVEELKCPHCGASLPLPEPGKDVVRCRYCGRLVRLVEEPKW